MGQRCLDKLGMTTKRLRTVILSLSKDLQSGLGRKNWGMSKLAETLTRGARGSYGSLRNRRLYAYCPFRAFCVFRSFSTTECRLTNEYFKTCISAYLCDSGGICWRRLHDNKTDCSCKGYRYQCALL